MCCKPPSFVMPFPEDGHMSGQNVVEAYGVCDILLDIYAHLLVFDITQYEMFVCKEKSCNIPTDYFLNINDGNAVKKSTVLLF
jgi:hypothetical protein